MGLRHRVTLVVALVLAITDIAVPATAAPAAVARLAGNSGIHIPGYDVEAFAHPTGQKPAVLWFWNRVQSEAQVDRTLQDMHDAGFTETVIFRMDAEPFFSPAWFDRVEDVLEKSRELGMKVWLDNDSQFPSGAAGGLIVNGGTVGGKTYRPRPDLGVKTAVRTGNVVVHGGDRVDVAGLFSSSIHIENGEVVADAAVFPGITLLKDGADWSDYTVDADFTVESGTAGFMVRSHDKRNGYLVDVRKAGYVDFWKQVDGSFSQLRLGSATPAGVDAQAGAYATGILAMMVSGAFAVTVSTIRRRKRLPAIGFGLLTAVLFYALAQNVIDKPDGIAISGLFIIGIIAVSLISRISRTTELRADRIEFDDDARRFITDTIAFDGQINLIAKRRRPGTADDPADYAAKEREQRGDNPVPGGADVTFLEIEVVDPSDFSEVLTVRGVEVDGHRVLRAAAPAAPNAIAAILLALRDSTGVRPHCYFAWAEGSPLVHMVRYFLLGRGDTAPVTREIIREHEPDPQRRPGIHVGA